MEMVANFSWRFVLTPLELVMDCARTDQDAEISYLDLHWKSPKKTRIQ